ncbi:MAG: hypothetical protein Q9187_001687 [Circinaria calcarea]
MEETQFYNLLEDLTGKSNESGRGAAGIGLETTIYLARKGCTVYVASRNKEKSLKGIAEAERRLDGHGGPIKFHLLDLASIDSARRSAEEFRRTEPRRIDLIIANAAVSLLPLKELSQDGYERVFATNHLGHFVFVTSLLDIVEDTATSHGEARIVVTSSAGYKGATKLDYKALTTPVPTDGSHWWHIFSSFRRYLTSKLANIYFTNELDRRLQARGITNVYCNSCHPGSAGGTGLGTGAIPGAVGRWVEVSAKAIITRVANTNADSAKTQVYLAASKEIREKNIHGQYWVPKWSWTIRFLRCEQEELTTLAKDQEEQRKLWELSERAVKDALAGTTKSDRVY